MNSSNLSWNSYIPFSLQTATNESLIYIFGCLPISVFGFFFCVASVYVLWSSEFKENLFIYLRIGCILMAIDLVTAVIRSILRGFICRTQACPIPNPFLQVLLLLFAYFPSPIEASALVTDIFASFNCLIMLKHNRNKFEEFIFNLNPYVTIGVVYLIFSLVFIYQCFTNAFLFNLDFVISNKIYFDLITFSIRDGLLLLILIIFNIIIAIKVKLNLKKKIAIVKENSTQQLSLKKMQRSQQRMSIMVLADSINSIFGRIPVLCVFVLRNLNLNPINSAFFLFTFLSYFLKFFIFLKFNKRFRIVALQKLPFIKVFFINNHLEPTVSKTNENSISTNKN